MSSSTYSYPCHWMEHDVTACLSPRKEPMVPLGYEARQALEPVWSLWRRKYFLLPGMEPLVVQPVDLPLYSVLGCVVIQSPTNSLTFRRIVLPPYSGRNCKLLTSCMFVLCIDPEYGCGMFLRNVDELIPDYTASYPLLHCVPTPLAE
jgi:hypothetical protein